MEDGLGGFVWGGFGGRRFVLKIEVIEKSVFSEEK